MGAKCLQNPIRHGFLGDIRGIAAVESLQYIIDPLNWTGSSHSAGAPIMAAPIRFT